MPASTHFKIFITSVKIKTVGISILGRICANITLFGSDIFVVFYDFRIQGNLLVRSLYV